MARKLRIEYPGALYHVMKRGDHREAIFRDDRDREGFIETLGEACAKTGWQVHAYCLMPNHFHLVVETPQGNLVGGMKRLQEFKAVRRGWCLGDKAFRKGKMEPRLESAGCGATERTMKGESAKSENRPLYGYTLNVAGATSYTNQITNVVLYAYDPMNRKTNEVYLGVCTNKFAYSGAGDLLTLTDGNGDKTSWNYDFYGRVTNKLDNLSDVLFVYQYDPDNRLTNRWSAAKTNTVYRYDAVGNLTNVVYPVSPSIVLAYDPLRRLTTMVDGVGTTAYGLPREMAEEVDSMVKSIKIAPLDGAICSAAYLTG